MKRFLSLFALTVAPVAAFSMDTAPATTTATCAPVSYLEETWAARTDVNAGFYNSSTRAFYGLNTMQPLFRSEGMNHVVFTQDGIGMRKVHKDALIGVGLGYRYLTSCGGHMFGAGLFYRDQQREHGSRKDGAGFDLSWDTQYSTLSMSRYQHQGHHWRHHSGKHAFNFDHNMTMADLAFQLPYLPWTQLDLGYTWHHGHHGGVKHLEYRVDMNLVGPLTLQFGHRRDFRKSGFVRFVVNFGRPAFNEFTLADSIVGDTVFTARDLKNYSLRPVSRFRID